MTRGWLALLAWGAGLLHLALGAAVVKAGGDAAAFVVLSTMLVLGALEIGWGADVLRRGRPAAPRAVVVIAVFGIALGVAGIAIGASPVAIATATGFVVVAATVTARLYGPRSHRRRAVSLRTPRAGTLGLVVGAIVVAAIATPALSATEAGIHAPEHVHGTTFDPHAGH